MEQILYQYNLNLTTWVYLSSLLMIAIYFKFNRLWSVRNLDLMVLIALSPGLLMTQPDSTIQYWGYVWLFAVGGLFLIRLLIDPMMVRRPLLEPNMSTGGLTFIGVCLLVFLMVNVLAKNPTEEDLAGAQRADQLLQRRETPANESNLARYGPGFPLMHLLPSLTTRALAPPDASTDVDENYKRRTAQIAAARTTAILAHLAIVIGIVLIGVRHFDNIRTGIATATLYLLVPYTAAMTGRCEHAIPAALLVWAVLMYRLPLVAGMFIGLSIGVIYYPLFLLPLWVGFYWQRGLPRFLIGVVVTLLLLTGSLVFFSSDATMFFALVKQMFGFTSLSLEGVDGFWSFGDTAVYRVPVLVAFLVLAVSLVLWPVQKNLGTLLSCSAAVMLGTQFWMARGGGMAMGWYLPLLLLTVFRPNLEDRIAASTLLDGWLMRRRTATRRRAA